MAAQPPAGIRLHHGGFPLAGITRMRAPCPERTSRWQIQEGRGHAWNLLQFLAAPVAARHRSDETVSVRVQWRVEHLIHRALLDVSSRVHHADAVREAGDLSAGVFDTAGRMIAQAVTGTPGHVNTMAAAVGHFMLIRAFDFASASVLAPLTYAEIVMMTLVGYVWFGDFPDLYTWIGTAVLIASGIYISWRERVRAGAA